MKRGEKKLWRNKKMRLRNYSFKFSIRASSKEEAERCQILHHLHLQIYHFKREEVYSLIKDYIMKGSFKNQKGI